MVMAQRAVLSSVLDTNYRCCSTEKLLPLR